MGQCVERSGSVLTPCHHGGTGMVLLAAEFKHNSTQTDDGFDDADAEITLL